MWNLDFRTKNLETLTFPNSKVLLQILNTGLFLHHLLVEGGKKGGLMTLGMLWQT